MAPKGYFASWPGGASGCSPLTALIDANPVPTLVIDREHRVVLWNRACEVLTGVAAAAVIGTRDQWRAFYPSERPIMADLIVQGVKEEEIDAFYHGKFRVSALIPGAYEAEDFFPNFGARGSWLFFTAAPLLNEQGQCIGAIETLQDVSDRHRAEAVRRESEAFLAQVVDGSPVATFVIDQDGRVRQWNRACEVLTGRSAREMIGSRDAWRAFYAVPRPVLAEVVLQGGDELERHYAGRYRASVLIPGACEAEDFFPAFGEHGRWLYFTAAPLHDSAGNCIGAIETLQDITERREAEAALRDSEERYRTLSVTDALTGLLNSRSFHHSLDQEIGRAQRYGRPFSLIILDADHFKQVNDRFGHPGGDRVLLSLAETINACLRRSDRAFRFGGEEFAMLLPETTLETAAVVAERLRREFAAKALFPLDGVCTHCTISIGVSQYVAGDTAQSLIRRADDGAYQAKRRGRNCVVVMEGPDSA